MFYGNLNKINIKKDKYTVSGHKSLWKYHSLYILGGYTTKEDKKENIYKVSRSDSFKISMPSCEISSVELALPSYYAMAKVNDYVIIHGGIFYKYEKQKQKAIVNNTLHVFLFEDETLKPVNIKTSSDTPPGLYHHQSAMFSNNTIVYFGGISEDDKKEEKPNDYIYFLELKLKSDNETLKKLKWKQRECSTPEFTPCARSGHTLVSHDNTDTCILYGGRDGEYNILNDMYILADDEKDKYQWIEPIFPKPSIRLPPLVNHCMEEYNDDCYIIYGGETVNGITNNQIYIFIMLKYPINDNDLMEFYVSVSKPLLSNALPSPTLSPSMTIHKHTIYIYGGDVEDTAYNDFYEYTITDKLIELEKPRESSLSRFLKELNLYYLIDLFLANKIKEKNDLDYVSEKRYKEMGLNLGEYRLIMKNIGFIKTLDNCIVKEYTKNDMILHNKKAIKELKEDGDLGDEDSNIYILDSTTIGLKESCILDKIKEVEEIVGDTNVDLKGFKAYNCVVCQDNVSKYAFIPCGHYGACEDCYNLLKGKDKFKCPICNYLNPEVVEVKLPPNDD